MAEMKIKHIEISKNRSEIIVENPSNKLMDNIRRYLDLKEQRRQVLIKHREILFPKFP